jgi:predicted esterase
MTDSPLAGPHRNAVVHSAGAAMEAAASAVILIHGRGASAESILELKPLLDFPDVVYLAPQASGYTWYPHSFLAPLDRNEPDLSSGLQVITDTVLRLEDAGMPAERVVIGGFSQGACLASEFVARNARRYGGLIVFSGGLIGPLGMDRSYAGSLDGTPVFLGCSDRDPHIPLERVDETADVLSSMGGSVVKQIYPDLGHTITGDEIDHARRIIASAAGVA